jgi:hypothetical protein
MTSGLSWGIRKLEMDAHLIGIDLAQFLPMHNASAIKQKPAKPAKPSAQPEMNFKEASTKPH